MLIAIFAVKKMKINELIETWEAESINQNEKGAIYETSNPFELSPYRLYDYIETISRLKFSTYMHFDPPVRFQKILNEWLKNFHFKDKQDAFLLASRILFITKYELEYLQKYTYRKFIDRFNIDIAKKLSDFLFVSIEEDVKIADFFSLNKIPGRKKVYNQTKNYIDSLDELLLPMRSIEKIERKIKNIVKSNITNKNELIRELGKKIAIYHSDIEKKKNKYKNRKHLILLTDFSGSGETIINDVSRLLKICMFDNIFLFSYIICIDSLQRLNRLARKYNDKLNIIFGLLIESKAKCFSQDSILFSDSERKNLRTLCEYYYPRLKDHPDVKRWPKIMKYGFKDTSLALVLHRNCPNNTLPIIWAGNKRWNSLFHRISSV